MTRLLLVLLPLAACGAATNVVDKRLDLPEPPEGGLAFVTPDYTIPGYSERQFCVAGTWQGDDMGIRGQQTFQSQMGHHVVLMGTSTPAMTVPDGTTWDCTELESLNMSDMEPILIGGDAVPREGEGVFGEFVLPDGMAAQLSHGQRYVIQSHYVNYSDDDILVHDAVYLDVVAEDEVQTWAAPLVATVTEFEIPSTGADWTLTFDCAWDEAYTMLYLGGHMHEYGTAFRTEHTHGGTTEVIYDIPVWDPVMRDAPEYLAFDDGAFEIAAGDVFTTSCTWFNDTGAPLGFPQEMCVTFGMVYPQKVPVICDAEVR